MFFHLPYRQEEGFVAALARLLSELRCLIIPPFTGGFGAADWGDEIVISLDSSGVKVTNRGGWVRAQGKRKWRKGYLKIHLAVDVKTKQILALEVTDERASDLSLS